ncbi:hypothetical protein [Mesorhizobium sp. IMUNJ 23232]|uniref:hypothetical protein n=1 Tax=Mesorhizobium sp. IMUNJ 23232 TaxID=3376064 RepID=UPI00379F1BF2
MAEAAGHVTIISELEKMVIAIGIRIDRKALLGHIFSGLEKKGLAKLSAPYGR